jgi:hypothetical protein
VSEELFMSEVGSIPSEEVLGHLQKTLLTAVLSRGFLPGGRQPLELPDLSFVLHQPTVLLSNENLARSVSLEGFSVPVRVLAPEEVVEEARSSGDTAYLQFGPAQEEGETVGLTLQARIVPQDPDLRALGLSGVQVRFRQAQDRWEAVDEPIFFAS